MRPSRRLLTQVAPFAAGALLGFVLVPVHNQVDWAEYGIAALLTLGVVAAAVAGGPTLVAPLVFVASVSMLRDAADEIAAAKRDLEMVTELSRSLVASGDARERLCSSVMAMSGAYFVLLL